MRNSRLDLPGRDSVQQKLREIVARLIPELRVDDLEMSHLADVVTNHALLLNDLYSAPSLDRIMGEDPAVALNMIPELARRTEDLTNETVRQIRRIPDDVRVVGDKCLYDVGLVGKHRHRGLDLRRLGVRCYGLASEILEHLAEDRRLREYFRQNMLSPLPIEEEIIFLRQCADRFSVYADVLRNLHMFDPVDLGTADERVGASGSPSAAPPAYPVHDPADPLQEAIDDIVDEEADEKAEESLKPVARRVPIPQELRVPGSENLPRRDLISFYERLVLFANLDVVQLRSDLDRVVVDQPDAVGALCDELSLYTTGTQTLTRPASFFLVGPTGVGKNHLVECFARSLEERWEIDVPTLLLEGPQFTYPSDINELKGAARGFIRSDEEGILTEFYGRASAAPLSIILVDEVEKAHPQLRKFFLGLMDRGTTMDNRGDILHFVNTIFFFTSNVGYSRVQTETAPIGFGGNDAREEHKFREVVQDLKKVMTPEFVNRVNVIRFMPLSLASVERIFDLELEKVTARYRQVQGIELVVTPEARHEMIRQGYTPEYGARPLSRVINRACNVEVSKRLKRDERRSERETGGLLDFLRDVRDGKRAFDPGSVGQILDHARVQVGYSGLEIGWDGTAFTYTSFGRPS